MTDKFNDDKILAYLCDVIDPKKNKNEVDRMDIVNNFALLMR